MSVPCSFSAGGFLDGAENAGRDRALTAPALRFSEVRPTASLGVFERLDTAARAEYCAEHGIAVVRRPTGGPAVYLDPDHLYWTLALPADVGTTLAGVAERHGEAVVAALGDGAFAAARGEVEVAGRRVGGLFAGRHGDLWLLQGHLALHCDVETTLTVLRAPTEKLSPQGVQSARQRMAGLDETLPGLDRATLQARLQAALADAFDLEFVTGREPTAVAETEASPSRLRGALSAFRPTPGGTLYAELEADGGVVAAASITGSVQLAPPELFAEVAATLAGVPLAEAAARIRAFLDGREMEFLGFGTDDLVAVVGQAATRPALEARLGLSREAANGVMVHGDAEAETTLGRAEVMLVPYCAKPTWCSWRHRDGCPECGKCEVGDAYRMARERGMEVVTITRFEHLQETFGRMRAAGVGAYVGMCCGNFYRKRHFAFEQAGMDAVLLDIRGANCYELRQEDQAYAGRFEAQAELDGEAVAGVMRFVPAVGG